MVELELGQGLEIHSVEISANQITEPIAVGTNHEAALINVPVD